MNDGEQMAIIEKIGVGRRDVDRPIIFFDVIGDGWGALQILELDDPRAHELLMAAYDIHDLNGRACVVDCGPFVGDTVKFVRLLRAARSR